ncbi:hypothetical protein SLS60_001170 [Paraconiothyrium brasiliense]|uniref:G protein-coupled receptor GPR1/2/3 C-terminal domain-containing protein n=1 Tax=Paraconiothyrium brasiliense TaxID=300254 RepID=A0ABR3S8C1_9PLEO
MEDPRAVLAKRYFAYPNSLDPMTPTFKKGLIPLVIFAMASLCWVSVDFEPERLWLHYLWIFIVEFGTMAIYGHIFFHLKGRLRSIINNDTSKLSRATKFMILYPAVYVFLTMPLAIGRMVSMAGVQLPDVFFCIAGSFLTSCGWVDALLYTLTRRVFVNSDVSGHAYNRTTNTGGNINVARAGDDYGLQTINKEVGRTVTIVGGTNRLSRMVDKKRRGHGLTEHSASGSQDSIIKPMAGTTGIAIVTETNIQVESASARDSEETQRKDSEGDLGKHAQP